MLLSRHPLTTDCSAATCSTCLCHANWRTRSAMLRAPAAAAQDTMPSPTASAAPSASTTTAASAPQRRHHLLVFDFDHTVVDGNTDAYIWRAATSGNKRPPELTAEPGHWTEYMQRVLSYLQSAEGVRVDDMRGVLTQMQYTPGMQQLLEALRGGRLGPDGPPCSAIVVSDSNTAFISWILQHQRHADVFSHVYSNPATICQEQGTLTMAPHHTHDCTDCPPNMCKRVIVQQHLAKHCARGQQGGMRLRVCYIGDGRNDLCAVQGLTQDDVVFARKGYKLDEALRVKPFSTSARVVRWQSGEQILNWLLAQVERDAGDDEGDWW